MTGYLHQPLPEIEASRFATGADLLRFVTLMALQDKPQSYWIIVWTTSSFNILVVTVIIAGLILFRRNKVETTFWVFRRTTRDQLWGRKPDFDVPTHGSSNSSDSSDTRVASSSQRIATAATPPKKSPLYITASCVNTHLIFSGCYCILLFLNVIEQWVTRDFRDFVPVDYWLLESAQSWALWTVACFGALGYIEILLPNVPARVWNLTVLGTYFIFVLFGIMFAYRAGAFSAMIIDLVPIIRDQVTQDGLEQPPSAEAILLARYAWSYAIVLGKWLRYLKASTAAAAFLAVIVYLVIFFNLTRKVGLEIVELRKRAGLNRFGKPISAKKDPAMAHDQELDRQKQIDDIDLHDHPILTTPEFHGPLCSFLLHCMTDHIMVTLQATCFGVIYTYSAIYLSEAFIKDPASAQKIECNLQMASSCVFSVLFPLNAMNLFAPFIWYPPAKIAAMTKRALRDREREQLITEEGAGIKQGHRHQQRHQQQHQRQQQAGGKNSNSVQQSSTQVLVHKSSFGTDSSSSSSSAFSCPACSKGQNTTNFRPVNGGGGAWDHLRPTCASPYERVVPNSTSNSCSCTTSRDKDPQDQMLRTRTSAQQLILDSLVSSHSLPIQGFYCRPPILTNSEDTLEELELVQDSNAKHDGRVVQKHRWVGVHKVDDAATPKSILTSGGGGAEATASPLQRQTSPKTPSSINFDLNAATPSRRDNQREDHWGSRPSSSWSTLSRSQTIPPSPLDAACPSSRLGCSLDLEDGPLSRFARSRALSISTVVNVDVELGPLPPYRKKSVRRGSAGPDSLVNSRARPSDTRSPNSSIGTETGFGSSDTINRTDSRPSA